MFFSHDVGNILLYHTAVDKAFIYINIHLSIIFDKAFCFIKDNRKLDLCSNATSVTQLFAEFICRA